MAFLFKRNKDKASSPDSDSPPSPTPAESPPDGKSKSASPPSNDSPPSPPDSSASKDSPPPNSSPTPPSPPPPPPSPPSNANSPPPPSKTPSSPPPSNSSPPPSSPQPNSPPPASPPPSPAGSQQPVGALPAASPPPPSSTPSPPAPPGSPLSPPPTVFSPPAINLWSPPGTSASTFPSEPPTDTSGPTGSARRSPSNSGSSESSVPVDQVRNSPPDQSVKTGVAIAVVVGVFILGFLLALLCLRRRRKRHNHYNSVYMMPSPYSSSVSSGTSFIKPNDGSGGDHYDVPPDNAGIGSSKTWFPYEELSAASGGFATQNILGRGGFGCVYKGCLHNGKEIAIKKLKDNSGQGDREFKAEVEIISRVHHRYLVSLVGYCITDSQRLLVYEFVPNGTLHYHLHNHSKPAMPWNLRVKVACGSARGIAYLHEDCSPRIIHRDIKSANILVDNNFEAKVADFGLAKIAQELESHTHVSTRVMGTFGYMAPEYASSGKLTEKSDVFSFGVVLLEMITGRKPVDETRPLGDESLVEWARPLMTEALENQNVDELADPRLQGNYDRGEMFRMIEAAAGCVRHSAAKRPKMSQVVRALDTMNGLDISNGTRPGESRIYDSGEQSAEIRMFQRMGFGSQEFSAEQH